MRHIMGCVAPLIADSRCAKMKEGVNGKEEEYIELCKILDSFNVPPKIVPVNLKAIVWGDALQAGVEEVAAREWARLGLFPEKFFGPGQEMVE